MQFAGGLTDQAVATTSLKRRERSPSPRPSKRRVPSYYSPQLHADAPPSLARGWSFDANGAGDDRAASSSERSSPGLDWLRRTQELHLATPPLGGQHPLAGNVLETGAAMDANGDVGMDGNAMQAEGTLPHEEHLAPSVDSRQTSEQNLYHPIPVAPHHAPPLHQHLAGSPQAQQDQPPPPSRPPSATSSGAALAQSQLGAASFGLAGPIDWSQQPASVLLGAEDSTMMMDDSTAGARKQSGGTAGGGGGWKVTMGYRADCIKCLQRVPGHYSHVVPT
ncbi:hypothetical protein RHOSPDRAFT_32066 [Rhodotorula sp. JG-1b]|nr:hypothetical protein RHOSPDRAFT_32066 [Rhodotorula sp. JG-1b]